MPRAALPLSYMAGNILLYGEMKSVTILQLVLEPFLSANSPPMQWINMGKNNGKEFGLLTVRSILLLRLQFCQSFPSFFLTEAIPFLCELKSAVRIGIKIYRKLCVL